MFDKLRIVFSIPELRQKILLTLLLLAIYRIGAHIAAPGVNVQALSDFIRNSAAAGFFGLYDMLGGGLSRATVFGRMALMKVSSPGPNNTVAGNLKSFAVHLMRKDFKFSPGVGS